MELHAHGIFFLSIAQPRTDGNRKGLIRLFTPHRIARTKPAAAAALSPRYKWLALSNTTLGILMAALNSNIILISLPAIFSGLHVDPMQSENVPYMLWMLMGYTVVTATLLVSFGRISDLYGRVRLYNMGFAVFSVTSVLLFLLPGDGVAGVRTIIILRLFQGVGAGFLFSNSTAIITDAFPSNQRGMAMGINQIAGIGGSLIGLIAGGLLADVDWRLVFLVSVPAGVFGTVWAYLKLKETTRPDRTAKIDWPGNITFALGLTVLLLGLTYGIMPYGSDKMGWRNPLVIGGCTAGLVLLAAFVVVELRAKDPMFHLRLFRIRAFSCGCISLFLSSVARGGLQFMLIIWLQGIWLPLHGFSFESTPLWSGIFMLPMMVGFFAMGPLSGLLSDRFGARWFSTGGMVLSVVGFLLLTLLPADFNYTVFFILLLILGFGMGMFSAPNTTAVMNAVPAKQRGASAGMRSTIQNTGIALSMTLYFSILLIGMVHQLPPVLEKALLAQGLPAASAAQIAQLPPTSALFSAFLGYNPMKSLIPSATLAALPAAARATLLGKRFFPLTIAPAVMGSLRVAFYLSAGMSAVAAVASFLRGGRFVYGETEKES